MARCTHLFELTLVVCPKGCGGTTARRQRVVGSQGRRPEAQRSAGRTVTDEQIAAVLKKAESIRDARLRLDISEGTLSKHVRANKELQRLYAEAKARGQKIGRERYNGGRP